MNSPDASLRSKHPERSQHVQNLLRGSKLTRVFHDSRDLVNMFKYCVVSVMIGWLAAKDWLFSNTVPYPYIESFGVSSSVIVAGLASYIVARASVWRDIILGFFTCFCLIYLFFSVSSPNYWSIMPASGIVVFAVAFPWPADPRWSRSNRLWLSPGVLLRRRCYVWASFIGLSVFILSHDSDLFGAVLTVSGIVAAGLLLRFTASRATEFATARVVLIAPYLICIISYWVMSLSPLFNGASWTWLGNGLSSGGPLDYYYCSESLFEAGVVSIILRGMILTIVLSSNASAILCWSSCRSNQVVELGKHESSESLQLSIGALICIISQVFVLPVFAPSIASDPTSTGAWTLNLSIASLIVASRTINSFEEKINPSAFRQKPMVTVGVALVAAISLVSLCMIPLFLVVGHLNQRNLPAGRAKYVPFESIPLSLKREADFELPVSQSLSNAHDMIRRGCGAHVNVIPSLSTALALVVTSDDRSPKVVRYVNAAILSLIISHQMDHARVLGMYLNARNYGYSSPGLNEAVAYYFHKSTAALSPADAEFLLSGGPTFESFHFRECGAPPKFVPSFYRYRYSLLPTPKGDVMHSGALNNEGQVVGSMLWTGNGFIWSNGRLSTFSNQPRPQAINNRAQIVGGNAIWSAGRETQWLGALPGYRDIEARDINDNGLVVGYVSNPLTFGENENADSANLDVAFIWKDGQISELELPTGFKSSRASSINASGQVAGWLLTNVGQTHAAVWERGRVHDLGAFGSGLVSTATCINNAGQVVGAAQHSDGSVTAFLWQNGAMHDLGKLAGDTKSRAYYVNNLGQVVGASFSGDVNNFTKSRAFLWDNAHGMRDLTPLLEADSSTHHELEGKTSAYSINDRGQIMGIYDPHIGDRYMFLLSPQVSDSDGK